MPTSRALRHPSRRLLPAGLAVAAWLAAVAVGPAAVLAADPATTSVTVSVVGDESHDPIDGALVTLTGSTPDDPEPVYEADETTGADGVATFTAVPLAAGDASVSLTAEASKSESTTVEGCTTERTWAGASEPVTAAADLTIEVLASRADETTCDDPGPTAPVLHGIVVGPAGGTFDVFEATVEMIRADGAAWGHPLEVAADGRFAARLQAWGTPDDPAHLTVRVNGAVVGHETEGDCTYDLAPRATYEANVSLADGHDPAEIALVAATDRVGGVCGTTGGGSTPAATLPPTDPIASAPPSDPAPLIALVLILGSGTAIGLLGRLRRRPD